MTSLIFLNIFYLRFLLLDKEETLWIPAYHPPSPRLRRDEASGNKSICSRAENRAEKEKGVYPPKI